MDIYVKGQGGFPGESGAGMRRASQGHGLQAVREQRPSLSIKKLHPSVEGFALLLVME